MLRDGEREDLLEWLCPSSGALMVLCLDTVLAYPGPIFLSPTLQLYLQLCELFYLLPMNSLPRPISQCYYLLLKI